MSQILCSESECIDKILEDYEENVTSRKDYYLWANKKYQDLTKRLSNPKNSQLVYKALNFITYLDSVSIADKKLKHEVRWSKFFKWDQDDIKKSLKEEFDPEGKEQVSIATQLLEIGRVKREELEKNVL